MVEKRTKRMIATVMSLVMILTLFTVSASAEYTEIAAIEQIVVFDMQEQLALVEAGTAIATTAIGGIIRSGVGTLTVGETEGGRKTLERSGRTADWNGIELTAALNLESGRDYEFVFRGNLPISTTFQVANSSYTNNIIWAPGTQGDFEFTMSYDALPDNLAGVPIRIQTNTSTTAFTITDIIITTTREADPVDPCECGYCDECIAVCDCGECEDCLVETVELPWHLSEAAAQLEDGASVTVLGPIRADGTATLTARQNIVIQDAQGWPELARDIGVGLDLTRPLAGGGLIFSPEVLGLEVGETYIWEIEGYRIGGTHRAAFGTVNAAGTTTINGSAENMLANNQGFRPGYFRLVRGITHTDAIEAYRFYGVGAGNVNPAAGDFRIANIRILQTTSRVLFETSFDSLDEDISMFTDGSATFDPELFGIIEDPYQTGNYVLRSIVPEGRGGDFWGIALQGEPIDAPLGAMWRVTMDVRKTDGAAGIIRLRAATNLLGAVNNWAAFQVQHNLPVSQEWTTYIAGPHLLPDFNGIHAFELMRASQTWTGTLHMNSIKVEVLYQPENQDAPTWQLDIPSLKDTFYNYFKVGNILDRFPGEDIEEMFIHHYNAITMENAMKPDAMSGGRGSYNFENADRVTNWAIDNGIEMTGHALLWHSQSATWVHGVAIPGTNPQQSTVPHAQARIHMQEFIENVAGHFSGRVVAWDVINEVIVSGGGAGSWTNNVRGSGLANPTHPWSRAYNTNHIPGTPWGFLEFIYDGFLFARQAAPDAQLLYNDYNDDNPNKSANIRDMINAVNARWATDTVNNPQASAEFGTAVFTARTSSNTDPQMIADRATNIAIVENYLAARGRLLIEGFGLQSHYGTGTNIATVRAAVGRYSEMPGVRLHVTELDITTAAGHGFGNNPGTRTSGQRMLYRQLFEMYMDNAHLFERVTFWGIADSNSWRGSSSPMLFAAPTVFDPVFRAKPVFYDIIELPEVYSAPGLTSMFTGGGRTAVFAEDRPIEFTITLGTRGGLELGGTSTNPADYRIKDLPEGLDVVSAGNGTVTVSGNLPIGRYEIFPWARKVEVVTGEAAILDRILGDWVGTRLAEPLVIYVEEGINLSDVPYTTVRPTIEEGILWDNALTLSLGEHTRRAAIHPEGMPTATGVAKLLWDDENLYVRVNVNDSTPFTDGDAHTVDGVEIFLGETGARMNMTGQNPVWQNQYRLARSAQYSSRWLTATSALVGSESWRRQVINNGEDGYVIFMAIPLRFDYGPVNGQMMLFDIMVNDANNDTATRTAEISIFDAAHNGFSNSNGWGEIFLRGAPTNRQAITATAGFGGTISPMSVPGKVWVTTGANQAFTITPAIGYVIDNVVINGESMGAITSYTFLNVISANTISATFRRADNVTEFPFVVYNDVFADGEFTTAVIIDLGEGNSVRTADLNSSMFTVSARNTGLNGVLAFAGTRNITRVYANTEQDVIGYITPMPGLNPAAPVPARGRFIVVEMEFFSPAGGLAHGGLTRNGSASMILNYSILANAPITLANGNVINSPGFAQSAVVSPVLDQFNAGRFEPEVGVAIPYTVFFNQEVEGPLPIFIYLHGGGRGPDLWASLRSASGGAMAATPYHQERNPMHVLVPQGNLFAGTGADTVAHLRNRDNLIALLQEWAKEGLVDMNRIYISGFSMGGMGTLGFVRTHYEYIAAAVPIAGAAPPSGAMIEANPGMTDVSLWSFRHRGEANVATTRGWEEFFVTGPGAGIWTAGNATTLDSNAVHRFPYFGYGWTAHESEAAVFGNRIGEIAASFKAGEDQDRFSNMYIFDWMNAQTREVERTELQEMIAYADALRAADFTRGTWSSLQAVLAVAKSVAADPNMTSVAEANATANLRAAINNLVRVGAPGPTVDWTALDAAISAGEIIEALGQRGIPRAQWSMFRTALNNGRVVRVNATTVQSQADAAAVQLSAAMENLPPQ